MSDLPIELSAALRDRRCVLWVCQRYELMEKAEPHSLDLPPAEARLRYRFQVRPIDLQLMSFYWEAVWTDGASGVIGDAARAANPEGGRLVVELARAEDAGSPIDTAQFLPVYVLPGLLRDSVPEVSRYGAMPARRRARVAWALQEQLARYPQRTIVVVGASELSDLDAILETLSDHPPAGARVLVVWERQGVAADVAAELQLPLLSYEEGLASFLAALDRAHTPRAGDVPKWAVRVGARPILLGAAEASRISRRFTLISERDLVAPTDINRDALLAFLRGDPDDWRGYAARLDFPRLYATDGGRSLPDATLEALSELQKGPPRGRETVELILPAEGGAGGTTLLRRTAWEVARAGYPTLVLRQGQIEVDIEDLLAFGLALVEKAGKDTQRETPLLVVCDVQHNEAPGVDELAVALRSRGRAALVLRAVRARGGTASIANSRVRRVLPVLEQRVSDSEVARLAQHFTDLAAAHSMPLSVPSAAEWSRYQQRNAFYAPGIMEPEGIFWVALQFFLLEGEADRRDFDAESALTGWIERRIQLIDDQRIRDVVGSVAVLSSLRLAAPLWPVLRPSFGGRFSSDFTRVLQLLDDVLNWEVEVPEIEDGVLLFRHPVIASAYLARGGAVSGAARLSLLRPVLEQLSGSKPGDLYIAETLASRVISPQRGADVTMTPPERLTVFSWLPALLAQQSQTVLHHWGRALYAAAEGGSLTYPERERLFVEAVTKLRRAVDLSRPGRASSEHPSHLWNTLATAYVRWQNVAQAAGEGSAKTEELWSRVVEAFEHSVALGHGQNAMPLMGYAHRLVDRAKSTASQQEREIILSETAEALELLDQAEVALEATGGADENDERFIANTRTAGLALIKRNYAEGYIQALKERGDDLGYFCEARLLLSDFPDRSGDPEAALRVLEEAHGAGTVLRASALGLLVRLLERSRGRWADFETQLGFYRLLEARSEGRWTSRDRFKCAVLCYQTGRHEEGRERFRRLREYAREEGLLYPRVQEFWRSKEPPHAPRVTVVRITSKISDFSAKGYVDDLKQEVILRPRQFPRPPRVGEPQRCVIRFEFSGPFAVPERFASAERERATAAL